MERLESTTKKIRIACFSELQDVAVTGRTRAQGRLRAVLLLAGSVIRLDIQELEGLNSMIKVAVARSANNRIGLELLSARVCMRKLIGLHTDASVRYKDVIPVAASFARSAFLQYEGHKSLLQDETRWQACRETALTPPDPAVYSPEAKPTPALKWSLKYNTALMKVVRAHGKQASDNTLVALLLPKSDFGGSAQGAGGHCGGAIVAANEFDTWVACAVTRSQAMLLKVGGGDRDCASNFLLSAHVIASMYDRVTEAAKKSIKLKLFTQSVLTQSWTPVDAPKELCQLRARYQRQDRAHALEDKGQADAQDDARVGQLDDEEEDAEPPDDQEDHEDPSTLDNEQLMRLLHGLDDVPEGENDESDDDVTALDDLNVQIAAAGANMKINGVDERVAERHAQMLLKDASGTMAPVEQETEAFLQELFVNGIASAGPETSGQQDNATDKSREKAQAAATAAPCARAPRVSARELEALWSGWQTALQEVCAALEHRSIHARRPLGDSRRLVMCCISVTSANVM